MEFLRCKLINSSGIAILIDVCMELKRQKIITKLVNVSPELLDVFQVHKVLTAFHIFPDEYAAIKQVRLDMKEKGNDYARLFERINNVDLKAKFNNEGIRLTPVTPLYCGLGFDIHCHLVTSLRLLILVYNI